VSRRIQTIFWWKYSFCGFDDSRERAVITIKVALYGRDVKFAAHGRMAVKGRVQNKARVARVTLALSVILERR
jgi:hypothetical protein